MKPLYHIKLIHAKKLLVFNNCTNQRCSWFFWDLRQVIREVMNFKKSHVVNFLLSTPMVPMAEVRSAENSNTAKWRSTHFVHIIYYHHFHCKNDFPSVRYLLQNLEHPPFPLLFFFGSGVLPILFALALLRPWCFQRSPPSYRNWRG